MSYPALLTTAGLRELPLFRVARKVGSMSSSMPLARVQRASDLLRAIPSVLESRLPPGWEVEWSLGEQVGSAMADGLLTVQAPDGSSSQLVVEAKVRLEPRELDAALRQARLLAIDLSDDPAARNGPLIAARFLSQRVREELVKRGANYIDATGNVRLALARPGLFIEAVGADRDPVPSERRLRSLKGTAAARVVRSLFEAEVPIQISQLASRSSVSAPQTSRVVDLLDREAVIQRDSRGSVISVDRTKLIERWTEDYSFLGTNVTGLYLEPRSFDKLLDRLRKVDLTYAVTGSLAARVIAEYADARLATIYVDDMDEAAESLALTRVAERGNVLLAEPYDDAVFNATWERDGVRYVALAQLAADLLTSPGRAPAEGEQLLRVLVGRRDD